VSQLERPIDAIDELIRPLLGDEAGDVGAPVAEDLVPDDFRRQLRPAD
jgi:hypothetical protein